MGFFILKRLFKCLSIRGNWLIEVKVLIDLIFFEYGENIIIVDKQLKFSNEFIGKVLFVLYCYIIGNCDGGYLLNIQYMFLYNIYINLEFEVRFIQVYLLMELMLKMFK